MKLNKIILAALLLLCPLFADAKKPQAEKVKIMSFNIRFVTSKDTCDFSWYKRRAPIVNMLDDISPDVVSLQEHGPKWIDYLKEKLAFYDFYVPDLEGLAPIPKKGSYSQVILWRKDKFEKVDGGRFFLSETPSEVSKGFGSSHYRNTTWIKLRNRKTGTEFYVFDTHIDHKVASAKQNGVLVNVEMIKNIVPEDEPVFLMGDMNMRRGSKTGEFMDPYYEYMNCTAENAKKAYRTVTYNGWGDTTKQGEIDYMYYRNAEPLKYEVIDSPDYGVEFISDHWPIVGIFKL